MIIHTNFLHLFGSLYTLVSHVTFRVCPRLRPHMNNSVISDQIQFQKPNSIENPVCIVTGANTGIGYQTCVELCRLGYTVVLACRSRQKGEKAVADISELSLNGKAVFIHPLDLSSFTSVHAFVSLFVEKFPNGLNALVVSLGEISYLSILAHIKCMIYLLVVKNNAGINSSGVSVDNLDLCFQTNFLGHFLLTNLLMQSLIKRKGKIVNLSSVMHHFAQPKSTIDDWRQVALPGTDNSYADSKLAAILFSIELNKRFGKHGIRSISVNPGAVNSDIWRSFPPFVLKHILGPIFKVIYLNTVDGCHTSVAAVINDFPSSAIYLQPYWLPGNVSKYSTGQNIYRTPMPVFEMLGPFVGYVVTNPRLPTNDTSLYCSQLWEMSEQICSVRT